MFAPQTTEVKLARFFCRYRHWLHPVGWLFVSQATVALFGFLATVVWSRLYSPESFGSYKVIVAAIGFVGAFCMAGIGESAALSSAQGKDGNLKSLLKHKVAANMFGGMALGAYAIYIFYRKGDIPLACGMVMAAVVFPLFNITELWNGWLSGKKKFAPLSIFRIVGAMAQCIALFGLGLAGELGLATNIGVILGAQALLNIVWMIYLWKIRTNSQKDENIIRYGHHTSLAMIVGGLCVSDILILNHYASETQIAIYSVALVFPEILKAICAVFVNAFTPSIYESKSLAEAKKKGWCVFYLLFFIFLILGALGYFTIPFLCYKIFGANYAPSSDYAQKIWIATALSNPFCIFNSVITSQKKISFSYAFNTGYPIGTAILYFCFARLGVDGMVAARILNLIFLVVIYCGSFHIYLQEKTRAS